MSSRPQSEGFGFVPTESEHHFLVTISPHKNESVYISEHFIWDESQARQTLSFALGHEDSKIRVALESRASLPGTDHDFFGHLP
jgi:hypothetical protein